MGWLKNWGANHAINGTKEDPVKLIKKLTDGAGADVVFEAAGGNSKKGLAGTKALLQAIDSLKPEGDLVILAMYGSEIVFPIGDMRTYGKKLIMPVFTTLKHMEHGANLILSGNVKIAPLITSHLSGIDKVPQSFQITGNKAESKSIAPAQVHIKE